MNFLRTCSECEHQFVCMYYPEKTKFEEQPIEFNEKLKDTPFYVMISCNYFKRIN